MNYQIGMVRSFCEAIWEAAGLTHEDARICVDVLLAGDIRGQRTHGTTHMKDYVERLLMGTTTNGTEIEMELTAPSALVVDAKYSVGLLRFRPSRKPLWPGSLLSDDGRQGKHDWI